MSQLKRRLPLKLSLAGTIANRLELPAVTRADGTGLTCCVCMTTVKLPVGHVLKYSDHTGHNGRSYRVRKAYATTGSSLLHPALLPDIDRKCFGKGQTHDFRYGWRDALIGARERGCEPILIQLEFKLAGRRRVGLGP